MPWQCNPFPMDDLYQDDFYSSYHHSYYNSLSSLSAIPPMVNDAKQVALSPRDPTPANNWRHSNDRLLSSVKGVGDAIGGIQSRAPSRSIPPTQYDTRSYTESVSRGSPLPPSNNSQYIHHREVTAPTPPVIHNKVPYSSLLLTDQ